jgi:hypothetical protein
MTDIGTAAAIVRSHRWYAGGQWLDMPGPAAASGDSGPEPR